MQSLVCVSVCLSVCLSVSVCHKYYRFLSHANLDEGINNSGEGHVNSRRFFECDLQSNSEKF